MKARVWKESNRWNWTVYYVDSSNLQMVVSGSRASWSEAFNQALKEMQYAEMW